MKVTDRVGGTGAMTLGVWKLRLSPTHPHAWIERGPRSIYHACFGTRCDRSQNRGDGTFERRLATFSQPAKTLSVCRRCTPAIGYTETCD